MDIMKEIIRQEKLDKFLKEQEDRLLKGEETVTYRKKKKKTAQLVGQILSGFAYGLIMGFFGNKRR